MRTEAGRALGSASESARSQESRDTQASDFVNGAKADSRDPSAWALCLTVCVDHSAAAASCDRSRRSAPRRERPHIYGTKPIHPNGGDLPWQISCARQCAALVRDMSPLKRIGGFRRRDSAQAIQQIQLSPNSAFADGERKLRLGVRRMKRRWRPPLPVIHEVCILVGRDLRTQVGGIVMKGKGVTVKTRTQKPDNIGELWGDPLVLPTEDVDLYKGSPGRSPRPLSRRISSNGFWSKTFSTIPGKFGGCAASKCTSSK
jgi:hypothetical protein